MQYTLEQFYNEGATLLEAGIDIRRALDMSVRNSSGGLRRSLRKVQAGIASGMTISEAFGSESGLFADDAEFIEGGEASGRLPESFRALARWHGLKAGAWRSVRSGLAYPAMVLHVAAFVTPFPDFYLGRLSTTGYLITALSFLAGVMYVPAAVVLLLCRLSGTRGMIRSVLDRLVLKVPLLGKGMRDMAVARYCGSFAALHDAGVPSVRCAETSLRLCGNSSVAAMFRGGADSAASGRPVSEGFSSRLPADVRAIWQTGEHSGRLSETLLHLSDSKRSEAESRLQDFARWLPRVVVLIMIAVLAVSILGRSSVFIRTMPF